MSDPTDIVTQVGEKAGPAGIGGFAMWLMIRLFKKSDHAEEQFRQEMRERMSKMEAAMESMKERIDKSGDKRNEKIDRLTEDVIRIQTKLEDMT